MKRAILLGCVVYGLVLPAWGLGQDDQVGDRRRSQHFRQQLDRNERQNPRRESQREELPGQNRSDRKIKLDEAILSLVRSLDLTENQREQLRQLLQTQRANLNIARDPQERQRRQEIVERLRKEGLKGVELRRALMRELGIDPPSRGGPKDERPRLERAELQQLMLQRRGELLEKLRAILTEEQMTKLEDALRNLNRESQRRRGSGDGLQPPPTGRNRQIEGGDQGEQQGGNGESQRRGPGGGGR